MACLHLQQRKTIRLLFRVGCEIGWRYLIAAPIPTATENSVHIFPRYGQTQDCAEVEAWLASDEARGLYWCESAWSDKINADEDGLFFARFDDLGHIWRFTDPNTALAFKMRFG